jgi:hypothetical protein
MHVKLLNTMEIKTNIGYYIAYSTTLEALELKPT